MTAPATGVRSRTRQAIVAAAVTTLASDPSASLADVADAAGVGRTTLHRYFAERSDLVAGVTEECGRAVAAAHACARLLDGTGREALLRLCREYFDLGDVLALVFNGVVELDGALSDDEAGLSVRVCERGHDDGSLDPGQPALWLVNVLWCSLYSGWAWMQEHGSSRHDALELLLRTLDGAVRPRG
ncbi:TetR/AcrR family transcriptional regulator [Arthrobacter ruber]|uniref:TetR/AcrR family transcriptional regulator n=1 Tax=Arthrobacter ruber TaxID=1258893 RepID=UPI00197AEB85|nr:TetR/AcrR family transcriptional regulator [Arthrobacter ruber]